jgi:hypothetical protein
VDQRKSVPKNTARKPFQPVNQTQTDQQQSIGGNWHATVVCWELLSVRIGGISGVALAESTQDEHVVQALAVQAADETLAKCICPWAPRGCFKDFNACGGSFRCPFD